MKILQLNIWTGRVKGALLDYLANNSFDVICLQEAVWADGRDDILEDFFISLDQIKEITGLQYESRATNWELNSFLGRKMYQGIAILSRGKIIDEKAVEVYPGVYNAKSAEDLIYHKYMAQRITLESGVNIFNYHGYWLKNPLGDENTVKAMKNVVALIKEVRGPVVLCGDFNIIHASPAMRELDFLHDLTEENGVDNTLSGLKFAGKVACDHILVDDNVKVVSFETEDKIVSDHKGLVAEIELL